jgi:AraC family carnitine catabolism transcriptional activator
MVNLSPSQLARLFRQHTGTSPARYLHALRLARARILLERTFLSVKQVMACVGLNDPSHFSRDFRRHHGFAPSQLRQLKWTTDAPPSECAISPRDGRNGHET